LSDLPLAESQSPQSQLSEILCSKTLHFAIFARGFFVFGCGNAALGYSWLLFLAVNGYKLR